MNSSALQMHFSYYLVSTRQNADNDHGSEQKKNSVSESSFVFGQNIRERAKVRLSCLPAFGNWLRCCMSSEKIVCGRCSQRYQCLSVFRWKRTVQPMTLPGEIPSQVEPITSCST